MLALIIVGGKEMNKIIMFIAVYRVLECLEKEEPNEELSSFLDRANPYVFTDRKPADSLIFSEFEKWVDKRNYELTYENSFEIAQKYVEENTDFADIFSKIDVDEWRDLIRIIEKEEGV